MSYIYIVGFGDTGRVKVGYSAATPERRIEAHKRGARAYLECDDFAEWTSPNHQEGAENERALINKIRRATAKRRIQARAAGRLDLAEAVS